jgi:FlaG/FlaF family flagellin (archaellin)
MDRRTAITVAVAVVLAVLFVLVLGVLRGADGTVPQGHAELLGGDARTFLFWVEPGKLP